MPVVVIVGGGASGVLTAAQLARSAAAADIGLRLLLVEPAEPGQGIAYSTTDPRHRLNVAARGMSAWPHDAEHFLHWLRHRVDARFPADGFAPRYLYARYLRDVLGDAHRSAPTVTVEHVRARVRSIHHRGLRFEVITDSGTSAVADAVVLATGNGPPATNWAPSALRDSPAFVADPWASAVAPARPGAHVVLVGAGLTMVDLAMQAGARGAHLHVVSRHGMLPLPHASTPEPAGAPPKFRAPAGASAAELRHAILGHIRAYGGDWRRAVDSLRPITAQLWEMLPTEERIRLITSSGRRWDRMRHRVPPEVGSWLHAQTATGRLTAHAAAVVDARELSDGVLAVHLSSGEVIDTELVINCTGPSVSIGAGTDPLQARLVQTGLARPGPLGIGLATLRDGRLIPACCEPPAIWAIGPLRRGELWESTAIPEIRDQARVLAQALIKQFAGPGWPARPPAAVPSGARHRCT